MDERGAVLLKEFDYMIAVQADELPLDDMKEQISEAIDKILSQRKTVACHPELEEQVKESLRQLGLNMDVVVSDTVETDKLYVMPHPEILRITS